MSDFNYIGLIWLVVGIGLVCGLRWGWPVFGHWLIHKLNVPNGKVIIWRRHTDGVRMSGFECPICKRLTHVHPQRISYKRMMRGEKWY